MDGMHEGYQTDDWQNGWDDSAPEFRSEERRVGKECS